MHATGAGIDPGHVASIVQGQANQRRGDSCVCALLRSERTGGTGNVYATREEVHLSIVLASSCWTLILFTLQQAIDECTRIKQEQCSVWTDSCLPTDILIFVCLTSVQFSGYYFIMFLPILALTTYRAYRSGISRQYQNNHNHHEQKQRCFFRRVSPTFTRTYAYVSPLTFFSIHPSNLLHCVGCLYICLRPRTKKEEEGPPREGEEAGVSLTSGPGDPASPAALVNKADRWESQSSSHPHLRREGAGSGTEEGGHTFMFVVCLSHFTIDHTSFPDRSGEYGEGGGRGGN